MEHSIKVSKLQYMEHKNGSLIIRHFPITPVNLPLKSGFEEMNMHLFNLDKPTQGKPKSNYNS